MERKLNPDVHIICGKCGCATMFKFKFYLDGNDNGTIYPSILITCVNCGTTTGLDEVVEDNTDWKKLGLVKKY